MADARVSITRRTALKRFANFLLLLMTAVCSAGFILILYPSRIRKKVTSFVYTCDVDDLPIRGVRQFYLDYEVHGTPVTSKVYIVNNGGSLFALSPVCSHLGCLVVWNRHRQRFLCPCHGGQYDIEGTVKEGPPPAPLSRLPLRVEGDKAFIGLRI